MPRKSGQKKTLTDKVEKIQKAIRVLAPEKKYYDVGSLANVVDNLPSINIAPYRQITVGTADFANRIGDKIRISGPFSLKTTWRLQGPTPHQVRMFAFIYKRNPDSVNSTWSTIVNLYLTSAYMNSQLATKSDKDWDNAKSFHTLYDQTKVINPNGENVDSKIQWNVNLSIPHKYSEVAYKDGTTNVTQNELFIGFIQEYDTSLTMDFHYRFAYTDA